MTHTVPRNTQVQIIGGITPYITIYITSYIIHVYTQVQIIGGITLHYYITTLLAIYYTCIHKYIQIIGGITHTLPANIIEDTISLSGIYRSLAQYLTDKLI